MCIRDSSWPQQPPSSQQPALGQLSSPVQPWLSSLLRPPVPLFFWLHPPPFWLTQFPVLLSSWPQQPTSSQQQAFALSASPAPLLLSSQPQFPVLLSSWPQKPTSSQQ